MEVGQRFDVVRIDNSDAYTNKLPIGSFHVGENYKGLGVDVFSPGLTISGKLYFSLNTSVVDNANCTKVGTLVITKVK